MASEKAIERMKKKIVPQLVAQRVIGIFFTFF